MPTASCTSQTWYQRAGKWGDEGCENRVDEECKNGDEGRKDGPKGGGMVTTDILIVRNPLSGVQVLVGLQIHTLTRP